MDDPGRLLAPLLGASLDNALRRGDEALTGPVARGDAGTVAAHVRVIAERAHESTDILASYLTLARATADRSLAQGRLRPEAAEQLLQALGQEHPPAT